MENIIHKIKQHWAAVVVSLIFGILMVLPFFYFQAKLGNNFKGILPEIVNDENFYYARIKDIVDGHSTLGNAYLFEHKNVLPQQLFLAEWLLAQPLKLFNIKISTGHLFYNFLLPAIAFLLTYLAMYLILRSRLWPLMFSAFLFFGFYTLSFIRPVSPQFNFIFWLSQFIFLWLLVNSHNNTNTRMYANDTNKMRDISHSRYSYVIHKFVLLGVNALNFGLLFYIYPYYWTFYLILFGLLFVIYFIKNRALAFKIAGIALSGLFLALPYFYFNYLSSRLPHYTETLTRLGMIYTRFPSGLRIIFWSGLGFAVFGWFLWKKIINLDIKTIFFVSGILASVIAVNQHLITGKNFEFSSHYDMAAMFFLVFAMSYLWQKLRERHNNLKILSTILIVVVLIFVAWGMFDYSQRVFAVDENAVYRQNYVAIFDWLNKNTPKDSVVYANPDLSRLIPVYAANNVFYIREANLFFISDKEVLDRFILNSYFEKFDENFIVKNDRSIYGVRYIDAYGHAVQGNKLRRFLGIKPEPEISLPDEEMVEVISRAKELQKGNFTEEIRNYRVDYLIWDKNKNSQWKINGKFFTPLFETSDIVIYRTLYF